MLRAMPRPVDYAALPTEQPNPRSRNFDRLPLSQLLRLINAEDATVPRAIARAIPAIEHGVRVLVRSLSTGGRVFFVGAGTSGRLGVIEAAECPPTFNTPPSMVQAIIAGGRGAVFRSREGAEDNRADAARRIAARVRRGDVVVGIAASGVTPFVAAALHTARELGAATVLLTCHPRADAAADVVIAPRVGPELITGSTRLKAGTATKLALNMLTVATMTQLGKVYGHWMVDVRPTSKKLAARALRIIQAVANVDEPQARRALRRCDGEVKTAIVVAAKAIDPDAARRLLADHRGRLREILETSRAARPPRIRRRRAAIATA